MVGPLAEMFEVRRELDGLHFVIELSRNLPFEAAWLHNSGRIRRNEAGRLYLRPSHFHLGARNRVHRHSRRFPSRRLSP